MSNKNGGRWFDVAVIGGGIVGTATAMALLEKEPDLSLVVLEKETRLGQHQTGRAAIDNTTDGPAMTLAKTGHRKQLAYRIS